jgi:hypothetical protein
MGSRGRRRRVPPPGRPASPWLSHAAYVFVLLTVAGGLVMFATDHFKRGGVLIAGAVFLAALARLFLPQERVGMLAIRSRALDVLLMATLAIVLGFVAVGLPPPR